MWEKNPRRGSGGDTGAAGSGDVSGPAVGVGRTGSGVAGACVMWEL